MPTENVIEVDLPPIGNKPISSAFDPSIFEAIKAGTNVKAPEVPDFKTDERPKPSEREQEQDAKLLADELEAEQKKMEKLPEPAKKVKAAEPEVEPEVTPEEPEEEPKPALKPFKLEKKGSVKTLTEEEELAKFDEESLPFAKKMAREARQWVLSQLSKKDKIIEESKKVAAQPKEGQLPDSYYMHDKAYLLDPQWEQSVGVMTQAQQELGYWEQQFAKIRNGDAQWDDLMIGQDGRLQGIKREANAQSEADLIKRINHANTLVQQHQAALNHLQTNYKQRVSQALSGVAQVENEFFPQFADDKAFKSHKLHDPVEALLTQKGMNKLVPASLFKKLMIHAQEQQEYISELEAKGVDTSIDDKIKAQPTSRDFKGGETGKKVVEGGFDPSAFEKLKKQRGYS